MFVEVEFRLLSKYILYLDCAFMLVCAPLIYIRDLDLSKANSSPAHVRLSIINARIFFYCNSIFASFIYIHIVRPQTILIVLFTTGTIIHLICRLVFAYYFYFLLNLCNMIGLIISLFYLHFLWNNFNTRYIFEIPQFFRQDVHTSRREKSRKRKRKKVDYNSEGSV